MKKFIVKLFKLGILIFILSLLTVAGFFVYLKLDANGVFMTKEEKHFYQKLKEFKESGKESIALKELTNFEWDYVGYIEPYGGIPIEPKDIRAKISKYDASEDIHHINECCPGMVFFSFKKQYGYVMHIYFLETKTNSFIYYEDAFLIKKI